MKLKHYVSIYIPSIKQNGARINDGVRDFITRDVASVLTGLHGGATVSNSIGYHEKTGQIEKIDRVKSFSARRIDRKEMRKLALYVRDQCEQESVAIEIDNTMEIIGENGK